jgi:primosomal protein N' (replication factor Y) (superfamily II helicase)
MIDHCAILTVAESGTPYQLTTTPQQWLQVLVDRPYPRDNHEDQQLLTYSIPCDLRVEIGDILSIPFGSQVIGGIAIRFLENVPPELEENQIRPIEEVIARGFFPNNYWQILEKVAHYYATDLITVVRVALPPGLLRSSQRRIRLKPETIPPGAEVFCTPISGQILSLLKNQKDGDYSAKYLQEKVKNANYGLRDLIKRGWVESYLEAPKSPNVKQKEAITLLINDFPADLTEKQRKFIEILRHQGGEMWLSELKELAATDPSKSLVKKGYVVIQLREILRLSSSIIAKDQAKTLTNSQKQALEAIKNLKGGESALLHGVTGSGKTEVYLQAIAPILEAGKSALILVPEIGLTPQLTDRFVARFSDQVYVYHSALSEGERYDTWRQMLTGTPQVIIGTRSAVFAPLPHLGMIILDEEHDTSFKQTQLLPTYHARTVAKWRAKLNNCPLILGSATPSLETWLESQDNRTLYLSLPNRIQNRPLPPVEIVDMRRELQRGNRSLFSQSLHSSLETLKEKGEQGILFVTRRGHSTFVSCRSCGYVLECPHCDVSLSYHHTQEGAEELLRCHYCNYGRIHPKQCPECGSPYLKFFGTGTQRVTQELTKEFPDLRWLRFDSDTTRNKNAAREILKQFTEGEVDVLVGTQMLTKGLDIERVTLVGVMAADGLLYHSDYRAAERAFQTLTQVAGRAGRGETEGRVIIQTYTPEHPVIRAVQTHDYEGFVEIELMQRESLNYPPYGGLVLIRFSGLDGEIVQKSAENVAEECVNNFGSEWDILGPAPATIMRVANRYRWQILLKLSGEEVDIGRLFRPLKSLVLPGVSMAIDVDPLTIE